MTQAKLTVGKEEAKKIGLLTRHTPSRYPILYDPKSGVNLHETKDGEYIVIPDGANIVNLLRMQAQGLFTVVEGAIGTSYDARLSAITLSAGTLDPAFNSDTYDYIATLPADSTVPATITVATPVTAGAAVIISDAGTLAEEAVIQVTSTNGKVARVYSIGFAVADPTVINIEAIPGVTAPATGATPVTTTTETTQYTGTVTWAPVDNPFLASTIYTATITLTPKAGFTLTGVTADFFTVAGATATNPADSGVVTAVFPITGA